MRYINVLFRTRSLRFFAISLWLLLNSNSLLAQPIVVDEIIAKVDNFIVLKSDLEKRYLDAISQGNPATNDLKCQILQSMMNEKLMVAKAEIDSVIVTEEEVNSNLNRRIQYILNQYNGSEDMILQYYGKTIEDIRIELREQIREQLTVNRMQTELTSSLYVTPSEVRKFFRRIPTDSLPFYDMEVTIAQITKVVEPGYEQEEIIRQKLIDLRKRIVNGEDFAVLAKEFSEGPSATVGGDLGMVKRGSMVPDFEAGALALKPGEVSMPVKSPFGYHLIKLETRRGNEYRARHILMIPKASETDIQETVNFMDSIRTLIVRDSITFDYAAREHSDDDFTKGSGGYFLDQAGSNRVSIRELSPEIYFAIDSLTENIITPVTTFQTEDGKTAARILYYKDSQPPHQANLQDDWGKIQAAALLEKKNKVLVEWFEEAKNDVFTYVDEEYQGCQIIN